MHFKDYASYYNLLYKDKNYKEEVEYINRLIKQFNPSAKTLIDLGCGTGKHIFEFEKLGFESTGVDLSSQMISIANETKPSEKSISEFYQGDIRNYRNENKFDAVVSLFHVMSYQTTNNDLENAFSTAKKLMSEKGIFIFDCWYGPGVLSDLPSARMKVFEDDILRVERKADASIDYNANIVEVVFDVSIENKIDKKNTQIIEIHPMRYIFKTEVDFLANKYEMELAETFKWNTNEAPSEKSWYVVFVLKSK